MRGDVVKISDFGLSINIAHEFNIGTRPYRAPESLLGSTYYNFTIDIWSQQWYYAVFTSQNPTQALHASLERINVEIRVRPHSSTQLTTNSFQAETSPYRLPEALVFTASR